MTAPQPAGDVRTTPAEQTARGLRGWVLRLVRRVAFAALRPELEESASRTARQSAETEALKGRLDATVGEVQASVATLAERFAALDPTLQRQAADLQCQAADFLREGTARTELQRHVETRLGQTGAELTDIRQAYLATRGEFEELRDRRVPELASRVDGSDGIVAALQSEFEALRDRRVPELASRLDGSEGITAALQREIEGLRDRRVPELASRLDGSEGITAALQREIEALRDERVSQAEHVLATLQGAIDGVQGELEEVRGIRLLRTEEALAQLHRVVEALQNELEGVRDGRVVRVETDLSRVQEGLSAVQGELESLRDGRLPRAEQDLERLQRALDDLQGAASGVQALGEELRDRRLPALSARVDALIGRLQEELVATSGLVERLALGEPLRVALEPAVEVEIPPAVAAASLRFMDSFRGARPEILGRLEEYLPLLADAAPVLELGCGRGELLELLQQAGVAARGVDRDPAMIAACRRLGLEVEEGDALGTLRGQPAGSLGGVAAIHLLEHLAAPVWMGVVEAAGKALRPGGVLLVECPNPDSLRVGAGLFWIDPTHRAPVHPEALEFVMRSLGFEVIERRLLHPFPPEQSLAAAGQPKQVRELAERLDGWLSGPRDFLVVAGKP